MKKLKSNPRVTYRMATKEDVMAFHDGEVPASLRAIAFFVDDELAALGGYSIQNGNFIAFSEIKDDVDVPDATVWRCAKLVMDMIKEKKAPMYVYPVENRFFLDRLGFNPYASNINGEVYQWVN